VPADPDPTRFCVIEPGNNFRAGCGRGEVSWEVMAEPDGSEFCLLTPR